MPNLSSLTELSKKLPARLPARPARPALAVPAPARHVMANAVRAGDRFTDELTEKLRHRGSAGKAAADALAKATVVSRRLAAPLRDAVLLEPGTEGDTTATAAPAAGAATPAAPADGASAATEAVVDTSADAPAPAKRARARARRKQADAPTG